MPPKKRRPRPARPEPEPKEPAGQARRSAPSPAEAGDPEQRGKADRHPTRFDPKAAGESGPTPDRVV